MPFDSVCSRCGCSEDRRLAPWFPFESASSRSPVATSIVGWFDNQMSRLEEDLFRHRFFDMPNPSPVIFDPQRRSRLFDALFSFDDVSTLPSFHINPTKNQVECQVPTGCGDFFRPEDVELNVNGRIVELKARREQKFPDGHSYVVREVGQLMTVPENADIDRLQAELAPNGKLMISAPLLTPASALESPKPDGPVPIKINRMV